jgi:hypothetical protein
MKSFVLAPAAAVALLLGGLSTASAAPAAAERPFNPVQFCRENNNTVQVATPEGTFPLQLPSAAACISTVAGSRGGPVSPQQVSLLSYLQQCQAYRANPQGTLGMTRQQFEAVFGTTLQSCIITLRGFHLGTITH